MRSENPGPARRAWTRVAAVAAAAAIGAGAAVGATALVGDGGSSAPPAAAPTQQPVAAQSTLGAREIYQQDNPGVVELQVVGSAGGSQGFPFGPQRQGAEGSGFVLDRNGNIVTNQHVVSGGGTITVVFSDGTKAKGTLVASDASTDLAVVRVDVAASKLKPLALGDSSAVRPGDPVVAIGSPLGNQGTITAGIVSAVGRQIQAPNGATIGNAIQTDAAITHGSSGGPLIDASGDVIGVNAQIDSDSNSAEGIGFAIPSNTVKSVAAQLAAGKTVEHAFLGVSIADSANPAGARVGTVSSGSAAAAAGLQVGDVITALDGQRVSGGDGLRAAIDARKPGDKVSITVVRDGSERTLQATLGRRTAAS